MTMVGRQATLAPSHTAAQPASYSFEGRTVRPLGNENDRAFALMATLDAAQRSQAILGYSVADLVLGPGKDGRTIQPEGPQGIGALGAAADDAHGPRPRVGRDRERRAGGAADGRDPGRPQGDLLRVERSHDRGSAAYFRIQGPTLVIEYAPQRGVDHIHTIYRDPTNDYGTRFARE
jgi:hypothetical protein